MTKETGEMPKTENMTAAEVRKQLPGIATRVQHVGHHVRFWRYRDPQAVMVPEDWYERACEALGELERVNLEAPAAAYKGFARKDKGGETGGDSSAAS